MSKSTHVQKFLDNKYIKNLEDKMQHKNHDEQLEIIYNAVADDLTCVSKKCDNTKLHPHTIVNQTVLDYAYWIQYYLLKLTFVYQEKTLGQTPEQKFDKNINEGPYKHQLLVIKNLHDTVESITHWGEFYEAEKRGKSINIIAIINLIFLPLTVIVGWFGMNFQSMGAPSLKNGGIFTVKYGQSFVFALFILFTLITMNFLYFNYDLGTLFGMDKWRPN